MNRAGQVTFQGNDGAYRQKVDQVYETRANRKNFLHSVLVVDSAGAIAFFFVNFSLSGGFPVASLLYLTLVALGVALAILAMPKNNGKGLYNALVVFLLAFTFGLYKFGTHLFVAPLGLTTLVNMASLIVHALTIFTTVQVRALFEARRS